MTSTASVTREIKALLAEVGVVTVQVTTDRDNRRISDTDPTMVRSSMIFLGDDKPEERSLAVAALQVSDIPDLEIRQCAYWIAVSRPAF